MLTGPFQTYVPCVHVRACARVCVWVWRAPQYAVVACACGVVVPSLGTLTRVLAPSPLHQITEENMASKAEIYTRTVTALRPNIDLLRPLLEFKRDVVAFFKLEFGILGGEPSRLPDDVSLRAA